MGLSFVLLLPYNGDQPPALPLKKDPIGSKRLQPPVCPAVCGIFRFMRHKVQWRLRGDLTDGTPLAGTACRSGRPFTKDLDSDRV